MEVLCLLLKILVNSCLQTNIMNYIIVIAAAAVTMVSSSPVIPCSSETDILTKCLSDNGLNQPDFTQYSQGSSFDVETIKKQCSQQSQYFAAYQCVTREFSRCSLTDIQLLSVDQIAQTLDLICNDPNLNFECIAQAQQQSSQLQSCVQEQFANANLASQTMQQIICQGAKSGVQCLVNLVSKCDAHTGRVMETVSQATFPSFCGDSNSR